MLSYQCTVCLKFLFFILGVCHLATVNAHFTSGMDEDSQLPFWEWRTDTVQFRLVQRLPDQSRAYFMDKGFSAKQSEEFAGSCVFQSIFRNLTDPGKGLVARYNLDEWTIVQGGSTSRLRTREYWQQRLSTLNIPQAGLIALQWSLLPTRHRYYGGDYNWGMTMYGIGYDKLFDLNFTWYENDVKKTASFAGLKCAPDIHPETDFFQ